MSSYVRLSVFTFVCPFSDFTFTPTLGGGNIKAYFTIVEQNFACNLCLLGIKGVYYKITHGVINLSHYI